MSEPPAIGGVVVLDEPSSPVRSPLKEGSDGDADAELDELLAANEGQLAVMGAIPSWVGELKEHIAVQFNQFNGLISGFLGDLRINLRSWKSLYRRCNYPPTMALLHQVPQGILLQTEDTRQGRLRLTTPYLQETITGQKDNNSNLSLMVLQHLVMVDPRWISPMPTRRTTTAS